MSLDDRLTLRFGASRLVLTPLEPVAWQPLAREHPGPAGLCLALLARAHPAWRGVIGGGRRRPSPARLARLPAGVLEALLPALCAPWLSRAEADELAELQRYARARADFPGLDCAECRRQEVRGEGSPDCGTCPLGRPPASAETALLLHPWLGSGPAGRLLLDSLRRTLGPRQQRLLAMRLKILEAARRLAPPARP